MLSRRDLLKAAAVSAGSGLAAAAPSKKPNIVLIMADDLGYRDLSCYGQDKFQTPNIDRLAAEGMRFTDAYSGCTVCAPSRSVLMTGYHMGHTSVRSNPGGTPLLASDVCFPQLLKQAGYATGGFGKWGLGDTGTGGVPSKHGFDEFFGYLNQVHAHFYYPEFLIDNEREFPLPGNKNGQRTTYSHDVIVDRALSFIRKNAKQPFFCYMPVTLPHWELLVPEDSFERFKGKYPESDIFRNGRGHYAPQAYPHAAYAAMITRMDRDVGRVMDLLRQLKVDDNTAVFFTSDNGPALPIIGDDFFRSKGPFRGFKQNMYEGGIRVPSIARWPGRIPKGAVSDLAWYFPDYLPTIAEIAGVTPQKGIDGLSIVPTLLGKGSQPKHEFLYWELPRYNDKSGAFLPDKYPMQAVRMGEWKAVRPEHDQPLELYNLKDDPGETKNVAAQNPGALRRIEEYLATARVPPRPQKQPRPWPVPPMLK